MKVDALIRYYKNRFDIEEDELILIISELLEDNEMYNQLRDFLADKYIHSNETMQLCLWDHSPREERPQQ